MSNRSLRAVLRSSVALAFFGALALTAAPAHAQCAAGQEECGGGCIPSGNVCCGSKGSCPPGYTCGPSQCESGGGGSGGGGGGSSSGGTSSGGFSCHNVPTNSCDMKTCFNTSTCEAYFEADGKRFNCASCTDITACDLAAADYCVGNGGGSSSGSGSSDDDSSSSCAMSPGERGAPSSALAFVALAGAVAFRRRRRAVAQTPRRQLCR